MYTKEIQGLIVQLKEHVGLSSSTKFQADHQTQEIKIQRQKNNDIERHFKKILDVVKFLLDQSYKYVDFWVRPQQKDGEGNLEFLKLIIKLSEKTQSKTQANSPMSTKARVKPLNLNFMDEPQEQKFFKSVRAPPKTTRNTMSRFDMSNTFVKCTSYVCQKERQQLRDQIEEQKAQIKLLEFQTQSLKELTKQLKDVEFQFLLQNQNLALKKTRDISGSLTGKENDEDLLEDSYDYSFEKPSKSRKVVREIQTCRNSRTGSFLDSTIQQPWPPSKSKDNQSSLTQLTVVDPYKNFFNMICQCVKLNAVELNIMNLSTAHLYDVLIANKIPFNLWYQHIKNNLMATAKPMLINNLGQTKSQVQSKQTVQICKSKKTSK